MNTEQQHLSQLIGQISNVSTLAERSAARIQALRYHYLLPTNLHHELAYLVEPLLAQGQSHDVSTDPLLARAELLLKPLEDRAIA